ncbi:MAG: MarR family transcriptional regulator, partial [Gammaproteobacteria bacterium]|nr:MarR family transcriptional regulator [Gammaproteobacteria bacterium]
DQRVVQLFLTSRGTEVLSDAPRPAQGAIINALNALSDNDLQQLNQGLGALMANMQVAETQAAMKPISE